MSINHGWTSHGYPCCSKALVTHDSTGPTEVARCGGTRRCPHCAHQAIEIHNTSPAVPPRSFVSRVEGKSIKDVVAWWGASLPAEDRAELTRELEAREETLLAGSRRAVSEEIADALQERSGVRPSSWAAAAELARNIGGTA